MNTEQGGRSELFINYEVFMTILKHRPAVFLVSFKFLKKRE